MYTTLLHSTALYCTLLHSTFEVEEPRVVKVKVDVAETVGEKTMTSPRARLGGGSLGVKAADGTLQPRVWGSV